MKFRYNSHLAAATILACTLLSSSSCNEQKTSDKEVIIASIAPIKYIVESITKDDFDIEILVPSGASPETFEPTPKQYIAINEAQAIMSTGLIEFEESILSKLNDKSRLVNLSEGIETIAGSCSHNHHEEHEEKHHHHGVDPHVWTSPVALQTMAQNCYNSIAKLYPDSVKYLKNYERLQLSLEELDNKVTGAILASQTKSFIIYHPAYTYFARDYNIEQIAIENEGKEPSAREIGKIIDRAKEEGVPHILYQQQHPSSVVEIIAKDADAECISVDPLQEDIVAHIEEFTKIITDRK